MVSGNQRISLSRDLAPTGLGAGRALKGLGPPSVGQQSCPPVGPLKGSRTSPSALTVWGPPPQTYHPDDSAPSRLESCRELGRRCLPSTRPSRRHDGGLKASSVAPLADAGRGD